jgi:hypothetical protein
MRFTESTYQSSPGGITTGQAGFYLDWRVNFGGIDIIGDTDNTNLIKALYQWHANNTMLYLTVIPKEMSVNVLRWITHALATVPTWGASDANLVKLTGLLQNFTHEKLMSNGVSVGVDFCFFSSVS